MLVTEPTVGNDAFLCLPESQDMDSRVKSTAWPVHTGSIALGTFMSITKWEKDTEAMP